MGTKPPMAKYDWLLWLLVLIAALVLLYVLTSCSFAMEQTPAPALSNVETGSKPVPPEVYRMFSDASGRPGVVWADWARLEPQRGQFRWDILDAQLAPLDAALLFVRVHGSEVGVLGTGVYFTDQTPTWVYTGLGRPVVGGRPVGHVLTLGSDRAVLPYYDSWSWRTDSQAMLRALGERYDGNPKVVGVIAVLGVDGETQPIKNVGGRDWWGALGTQASGVEYRWGQLIPVTLDTVTTAFPHTTAYLNMAPGGNARRVWADLAATYSGRVGLKHSGGWTSLDSYQGYESAVGSWDMFNLYSMTLPIWVESAYGTDYSPGCNSDPTRCEARYWTLPLMLHVHPEAMSLHSAYQDGVPAPWLAWARSYLGVTLETTPGVWVIFRDMEYPRNGNYSDHVGPWTFWLTARGGRAVSRSGLPTEASRADIRGRWAQEVGTSDLLALDVATGYKRAQYALELTAIGQGQTVRLDWRRMDGGYQTEQVTLPNTGTWEVITLPIGAMDVSGTEDLRLYGPLWLHKAELRPATPTPTPTPTATLYPTMTPVLPTATTTPTPVATPVPTGVPTVTIERAAADLRRRIATEWGQASDIIIYVGREER